MRATHCFLRVGCLNRRRLATCLLTGQGGDCQRGRSAAVGGLLVRSRHLLRVSGDAETRHSPESHGTAATAAAALAEDEEQLLRFLVQDAFHPANSPSATQPYPTQSPQPPPSEQQPRDSGHCAAAGDDQARRDADSTAATGISRVRAANAEAEPFARVRRKAYTFVVNESKSLTSSEDAVEWMCTQCQTYNFMKRTTCRRCGSFATDSHRDKHPPVRHVVLFSPAWLCTGCGATNGTAAASSSAAADTTSTDSSPPRGLHQQQQRAAREKFCCSQCHRPFHGAADWCCPDCHNLNPKAAVQCASCYRDQPIGWCCAGCGYEHNSIFSLVCIKCARQQSPITESDAVVRCPSCGARNDVRWELCGDCMAPLPALLAALEGSARDSAAAAEARSTPPPVAAPAAPLPAGGEAVAQSTDAATAHAEEAGEAPEAPAKPAEGRGTRPSSGGEVDGSWWCANCNVVQRRNASFCDICLRPRFLAQLQAGRDSSSGGSPAGSSASPPSVVSPGMWQCPYCRQYRLVTQSSCCDKAREVPTGYWLCQACHSTNRDERKKCLGCGGAPTAGPWCCPTCQTNNSPNTFTCAVCATAHPTLWRCAACNTDVHSSEAACPSCGTARPAPAARLECPVCQAPNAATRKSCFRCRGRLQEDGWRCDACHTPVADRHLWRCPECQTPREFDPREETWVCEVCESAVASGGSLPVRTQCPRCGADRSNESCVAFPSRWRCRRCRRFNWSKSPECAECGERRCIPDLHTAVHCPHCFRRTVLDSDETCSHCRGSLSDVLTEAGNPISSSGRGIFTTLEDVEDTFGLRRSPPHTPPLRDKREDDGHQSGVGQPEPVSAAAPVAASVAALCGDSAALGGSTDHGAVLQEAEDEEDLLSEECFLTEGDLLPSTWICARCESPNTEEYLACVRCGSPRS